MQQQQQWIVHNHCIRIIEAWHGPGLGCSTVTVIAATVTAVVYRICLTCRGPATVDPCCQCSRV